jgi:hypothetical protein
MATDPLLVRFAFGLVAVLWSLLLGITVFFLNETWKTIKEVKAQLQGHEVAFAEIRKDLEHLVPAAERRQTDRRHG